MGYAVPTQIGRGIHLRQYSRAFIIADSTNTSRVVFISADICMATQAVKIQVWGDVMKPILFHTGVCVCVCVLLLLLYDQVIQKLKALYGNLYTHENVLISGIHTHSGPAGYFQYVLYEVHTPLNLHCPEYSCS